MPQVVVPAFLAAVTQAGVLYATTTLSAAAIFAAAAKTFIITAVLSAAAYVLTPKPELGSVKGSASNRIISAAQNAVWVMGEAKVTGLPVAYRVGGPNSIGGARRFTQIFALSEGACEEITGVIINGQRWQLARETIMDNGYPRDLLVATYRRLSQGRFNNDVHAARWGYERATRLVGNNSSERRPLHWRDHGVFSSYGTRYSVGNKDRIVELYPLFVMVPMLDADGVTSQKIREAMAHGSGTSWTTRHKLNGVSYVCVSVLQNTYPRDKPDQRVYSGPPTIEFIVKGIKVRTPNAEGVLQPAEWTANAAKLRHWWLCERRGIPPARIDNTHLQAAISVCDTELDTTELNLSGDTTVKRYEINGSISSGDSPAAIEEAMDVAMAGHTTLWDGDYLIRPGAERDAVLTITGEDLLDETEPVLRPTPDLINKINKVTAVVESSKRHNWQSTTVDAHDPAAELHDGELLTAHPVRLNFINDPVQAGNIVSGYLKEARNSLSVSLVCRPRPDWSILTLKPGDKVNLTLPEFNFTDKAFYVAENRVRPDWAVELQLQEWATDRFADVINPVDELDDDPPPPSALDDIDNLEAYTERVVVGWRIHISWDQHADSTSIDVEGPETFNVSVGTSGSTYIDVTQPGDYTIRAQRFTDTNASGVTELDITVGAVGDITAPVPTTTQEGNVIRIEFDSEDPNLTGIEVRFNRTDLGGAEPAAIDTETAWGTATRLDVIAVLPEVAGENVFATAHLPVSGRYALALKLIGVGNEVSAVVDLGQFVVSLPANRTWNWQEWPTFGGTKSGFEIWPHETQGNLLMSSCGVANAKTFDEWDGESGFPFGQWPHITYTQRYELGRTYNVSVDLSYTLVTADGGNDSSLADPCVCSVSLNGNDWIDYSGTSVVLNNTSDIYIRISNGTNATDAFNGDFAISRISVNAREV